MGETGYSPDALRKVERLLALLAGINRDPYLKNIFALRGGTALHYFYSAKPSRLSVDIDLDAVGIPGLNDLRAARPSIEVSLENAIRDQDLRIARRPRGHSGGKWILRARSEQLQGLGRISLDTNFSRRLPLFPSIWGNSSVIDGLDPIRNVHLVSIPDIVGSKLAALTVRSKPRDVFDANYIFTNTHLFTDDAKLAFVVYGSCGNKDIRDWSPLDITCKQEDVRNQLIPLLPNSNDYRRLAEVQELARAMEMTCQENVAPYLALQEHEEEFVRLVRDEKTIDASLLTDDGDLQTRIESMPPLLWILDKRNALPPRDTDNPSQFRS